MNHPAAPMGVCSQEPRTSIGAEVEPSTPTGVLDARPTAASVVLSSLYAMSIQA